MSGKDPSTWVIFRCHPGDSSAGSWMGSRGVRQKPGILMWNAGIPCSRLAATCNSHPWVHTLNPILMAWLSSTPSETQCWISSAEMRKSSCIDINHGLVLWGKKIPLRKNLLYKCSLKITKAITKHKNILISKFLLASCKHPKAREEPEMFGKFS